MGVLNRISASVVLFAALFTIAGQSSVSGALPDRILEFRDANYSVWTHGNITYISSTSYNAKGMGPLYRIANQILGWFVGDVVVPEGYLEFSENSVKFGPKVYENDWNDLLKHYWGILVVVAFCALIIVLMPIIGFCFCCCRCAGACGGRSQPFDKKHDTCRRVFLGLLLICAGTGLIFGVVVAFVTNSYLQQGVENATFSARHGVDDSQKFLKTTSAEVNHLLIQNYDELSNHLSYMLKDTATVVIDRLEEKSKAISLVQLTNFVSGLEQIKLDLVRLKDITNGLRVNASQLSDGLRGVKRVLLVSLTKCTTPSCKDVLEQYEIGKLDINGIDYNQIPDLTETITNVGTLIDDDTIESIKDGQNQLENIRQNLETTINENIPGVNHAILDAGVAISKVSYEITNMFEKISDVAGNNSYKYFDTADWYIKEYSKYNYYGGLALSSTLLLILMCIVLGLLCGICGKRPDGYGDDCCNKGAGSRFLMIGVALIFLTISILTACALIYFLVGLGLRRGACIPLDNPTEDQIFGFLDASIDLNQILYPPEKRAKIKEVGLKSSARQLEPFRPSQLIDSCHRNASIYNVLRFYNFYDIKDIGEYPKRYEIDQKLEDLIEKIEVQTDVELFSEKAQEGFDKLLISDLKDFHDYKFLDNLSESITTYNLDEIANKLKETAEQIPNTSEMADVKTSLKNQALHLKSYQENLVDPMVDQTAEMRQLVQKLDHTLKFNRSSFEEGITSLREEIEVAQRYIKENGTNFVKQVAEELASSFLYEINTYLRHVMNKTENDLGRCGPLSNVYKSLLVAGCNRVVDPFNGFWAGIGWSILIFLPTIIICVKLSSLYQKSDPYPGPLVESEYLYDAYSERDNIPLANGPKNKRRNKKNERRRSSRDRRGDYYEDSGSPHGPSGGSRDARYNDMAPKHWNGGPPRYQNPPMAPPASEYERPPPYYFPGAVSEPE